MSHHEQLTQRENNINEPIQRKIGATTMHSAEVPIAIYEISELSAERQATYSERDRTQRCFCLCGDDRCLTAESTDALKREGAASPDNALRVFGGAQGIAHIFAVSIAAQYGRQKLQE